MREWPMCVRGCFIYLHDCNQFVPKIGADCGKDIPVTREGLAVVHFYDDVCELSFIVQSFKLLKDIAGVYGIYPVVVGAWRRPILNL